MLGLAIDRSPMKRKLSKLAVTMQAKKSQRNKLNESAPNTFNEVTERDESDSF